MSARAGLLRACRGVVLACAALPAAACGTLPSTMPLAPAEGPKENMARAQTRVLSAQLDRYRVLYGDYPESLEQLTQPGPGGQPPLLTGGLFDPWGNRYQFDPAGPKNNGGRADVWATAPDDRVIGNWER